MFSHCNRDANISSTDAFLKYESSKINCTHVFKPSFRAEKSEIKTFYETKGIVDFVLNFFRFFVFCYDPSEV